MEYKSSVAARRASEKYRKNHPEKTYRTWRNSHLKRTYGITLEEYESIFEDQQGCCAICTYVCKEDENLYVDHCHSTGRIRGLLCNACNVGLGQFRDDETLVLSALEYLRRDFNAI